MTSYQNNTSSAIPGTSAVPTVTPASNASDFVDRRQAGDNQAGLERRQFGNSHNGLSQDARELAEAIDAYKVKNHRRYVTFEEMLQVIRDLGYRRDS